MIRVRFVALALALTTTTPLALAAVSDPGAGAAAATRQTRTTLLAANFQSTPTGPMSPTSFGRTLNGTASSRAFDDSSVIRKRSGNRVYRLVLQKGTVWGTPSGNHGIVVPLTLPRKVDNACMRYDIRFSKTFDWSLGGKLPGLSGVAPGVTPTYPTGGGNPGDKGWSGRMMWRTGKPNTMVSYMYGPRQSSYYGDDINWNRSFTAGRWHRVRQCYVMNTVGKANGVLRTWLDGRLVVNRTNHVYRTRSDVHISHVQWAIFRGGSTMEWAGDRDGFVEIDNVRVSTLS